MKYTLLGVKQALEACYVCDVNPISVSDFISLFCERYNLREDKESVRLRGMLRALQKQEIITVTDDVISMHNILRSKIRMEII